MYCALTAHGGALEVGYRPGLPEELRDTLDALDESGLASRLAAVLLDGRTRDIQRGMTLIGPHRDDVAFLIDGHDAASTASRGEQRTAALALRPAEVTLSTDRSGEAPVLLLDDILSELDAARRDRVPPAASGGERERKDDMQLQFGHRYSEAVEYVHMVDSAEIQDGDIEVIGPDIDSVEVGGAMPLALDVRVAGRKMQRDFEGIMERQLHRYLSHAMGFMHTGQRDQIWCRVSKKAFEAGLRLAHLGTIAHAKLHDDYAGLVDKVAVRIITDPEQVAVVAAEAREAFDYRDDRIRDMTDESVDIYYSCTICQSYAPDHVCVITPQRLGLCGAYNWLDGRANYEINPTGPNQPIQKGRTLDVTKGEWEGVNKFVYEFSNHQVERFGAYSLLEEPMTSCGRVECIVALLPGANRVTTVKRACAGPAPCGVRVGELASVTGGGAQTPGFVGVGRLYLSSPKFLRAEGGIKRIVWMPQDLKEGVRERFQAEAERQGVPDLLDKIATEADAMSEEEVAEHRAKVGHPAVELEMMM